ncbi:hypothetical protein MWU49_07430 [Alcanivorax sp. S6407]|uniref:hypothetical protein n=1 Tax=Alcanivorax sp. S6407 TaxID=2926424 RepID=UPI001FF1C1D0|nr:hypothetical protein [Alcanivorax sp. S6407]MCK0153528.1 hypothetical protein [Alcanivorax sp. S6407]
MIRGNVILRLILIVGLCYPLASLAGPDLTDEQQGMLEQALGPRPEIRNYDRQDQFVTDLLAWKARRKELTDRLLEGEAILPPEPEKPDDWHHVTGPEDLDTALQNAEGYQQPNYKEARRYDRTTHLSFPLPPLGKQQLAREQLKPVRPPLKGNHRQPSTETQRLLSHAGEQ